MQPRTVQYAFFFALLILTTLAFLGLIEAFWQPIFWAAVLATLFHRLQKRVEARLRGRPSLAALLTLLAIVVMVILPLFLIGAAVTRESLALYERITTGEVDVQAPVRFVEQALPIVSEYLDRFGVDPAKITQGASDAVVVVSQYLAAQALVIGSNALRFAALFFLMLYLLFFFLRDGDRLVDQIVRALPFGDVRERRLMAKFAEVSRATIKGTLVVGVVQGTLGGLLFWMLGLAAPVFWGVIMTVLSLLPAVGSGIVWLPAAIILLATGQVVKGLVLIAAGTLVIGLVDNVLRPVLVGRDTKMPDFLILLSTLGGLAVFGLSGFVIGPVIAAFFLVVWEMFAEEFAERVEDETGEGARGEPLYEAEAAAPPASPPPHPVVGEREA